MKFRMGFVTNSSSSSFICIAKVKMCDELKKYMKEEYGRFGERLLDYYVEKGSDILSSSYNKIAETLDWVDMSDEIEEDEYYISAEFITSTNDGETNGDDAFLYEAIPDGYMEEIYSGED